MKLGGSHLRVYSLGGATRNRTGDEGFADLCLTAWLWRHEMKDKRGEGRGEEPKQGREQV